MLCLRSISSLIQPSNEDPVELKEKGTLVFRILRPGAFRRVGGRADTGCFAALRDIKICSL